MGKSHLVWLMSHARWLQKPSRCIPNNFLKASITTDTMKIFSITFCTLVTVYYLQNSERRFQNCALRYNFLHPALCCSSFDLKTVICLRLYVCSWYVQFCMLLKDSVLVLSGLLIGCGKKWEILRHFQGKLCGKKGLLCGKLCDFFKADLTLFF